MAYSRIVVELVEGHQTTGKPLDKVCSCEGGMPTLASLLAGDKVVLPSGISGEVATVTKLDMDEDGLVMGTTQLSPVE